MAEREVVFVYTESMTNPVRAEEIFREMKDMGATGVAFHAYELDLQRLSKDVPRIHEIATRVGLKRHISTARLGGMTAGLYSHPDVYTYVHPESRVTPRAAPGPRSNLSLGGYMACVNDPGFRAYALDYLDGVLRQLGADGLIIDEPQGVVRPIVCDCERCAAAQRPDETKEAAQHRFRVEFWSELCAKARARVPKIRTTMVAAVGVEQPAKFEGFARVQGLDAIGVEPYWSFVGEDVRWVEATCATAVERVRGVGKQLDIWVQNFGLKTSQQADLPEVFRITAAAKPDAIWCFWWWRACDDPAEVMRLTRQGLAAIR